MKKIIGFTSVLLIGIMVIVANQAKSSNHNYNSINSIEENINLDSLVALDSTTERFPKIILKDDKKGNELLKLDKLKVDIKVIGNIATTTLDMTFFEYL